MYKLETVNYGGYVFSDFYVQQSPATGPGWYVFGRNAEKYGKLNNGQGAYTMLCARPDIPARKHPHYNVKVARGWHTKREAQAIADHLNANGATAPCSAMTSTARQRSPAQTGICG